MAPSTVNDDSAMILKAEYTAPAHSKTFAHGLPALSITSTAEKSAYLSALRIAVVQLQKEVNTLLTAKMEEDKALASMAGGKVDDKQEEENYGEEVVEDI